MMCTDAFILSFYTFSFVVFLSERFDSCGVMISIIDSSEGRC